MKIVLVGGAVRDALLGVEVKDRDWVVVGATAKDLLALNYQQVGKDFPVFLHPDTKEEYALARVERKVARGYQGFQFDTSPTVTLEEDLLRRDLTINAMAQTEKGELIDPYHGKADLDAKCLRHVSEAFVEDPVRILRVARFAARLPDFTVHPETNYLMQLMVGNGEVDALVPERVWQEFYRALSERAPLRFFEVLSDCGAFDRLFRGLVLDKNEFQFICEQTDNPALRFAALMMNSPKRQQICKSLTAPNRERELVGVSAKLRDPFLTLDEKNAKAILDILLMSDAFRRPDRFDALLRLLRLIQTYHQQPGNQVKTLQRALVACHALDIKTLIKDIPGERIPELILDARQRAIDDTLFN
jgi:tRNA nucleotidyltransferase (CCA-adding enzyme)